MKQNLISHAQEQPTQKRAFTRRDFLSTSLKAGAAAFTSAILPRLSVNAECKFNVLFISVDDMRPLLGCYNHPEMHTPNIDRIAQQGTVFNRAYCQHPLCNPSRGSVLTGLRPNSTGILVNTVSRDDTLPNLTIPQHFKDYGYHTRSIGKIAHGWYARTDKVSWSAPIWTIPYESDYFWAKPDAWQSLDVVDDKLRDGRYARKAAEVMKEIKDIPFFLAVGFDRPHAPFHAPQKYFDLYSIQDFTLPTNSKLPQNAPLFSLPADPYKYPDQVTLELIRAYAACISYVDAQVGILLDQLDQLDLTEKTLIVLWSDHGFHTGEHARWEKSTLFEVGLRSPLIVSIPGQSHVGVNTDALVELVDIFPTLCDACQLPIPIDLEGSSMVPVIEQPTRQWKNAAFSQLRRIRENTYYTRKSLTSMTGIDFSLGNVLDGYSMRTDQYRYTEWGAYSEDGEKLAELGAELYDYQTDPDETINVANLPENGELVAHLSERLRSGWQAALPDVSEQIRVLKTLPWDINNDGIVDIRDLIMVSNSFGVNASEYPNVDVNKDGSIDIVDLLLVAVHLGESCDPTAPSAHPNILPEHFDIVEKWLTEAHLTDDGSNVFKHGIAALEHLIDTVSPKKTVLLPNYPNPFNPETWIPYDLADDTDVHIYIYNLKGESIQHIKVGFQTAGAYRTRSRAAYWDGKNTTGEYVSSGIYFFALYAGQIHAIRKMVVKK